LSGSELDHRWSSSCFQLHAPDTSLRKLCKCPAGEGQQSYHVLSSFSIGVAWLRWYVDLLQQP